MKRLRGALGWCAVAAVALTLGACDDPQKNCHDIANKYDECAPKIIEQALVHLPETFKVAADQAKQGQQQKIDDTVADLRAQCGGAEFSDIEKRQFRKWRVCLKVECSEFTNCIGGKGKRTAPR